MPFAIAAVGGLVAIRIRSRRLLVVALAAPFVLVGAGTLAALAIF